MQTYTISLPELNLDKNNHVKRHRGRSYALLWIDYKCDKININENSNGHPYRLR